MAGEKDGKASRGEGGAFLPASIEAAWGLRERPTKGPKPGLSLDRIVGAAVDLASAEGLAAVSMGRVAKELGVSTMSLYRYVSAKNELYVLMQEAATGAPPELFGPDTGWREGLERWAWAIRKVYLRHRWLLRVPVSGPPATPNSVAWWEQALVALGGTGLDEGEKLGVAMLLGGFVKNDALMAVELAEAMAGSEGAPQEVMRQYSGTLRRLVDPAVYPQVARVIESGVLDRADDPDDEFRFGLARILDGVAALVEGRAA
ncbi:TetR family transcriptional regulator [Streptomyces sp. NE5-10]|uniref:TetR/AcrR family transcriptional regulator n=1 Tax=Streptomyces sp. NE5-10 TaxID=2759674 RepID=UPI001A485E4C|nr:TetR/AcrR family transcriptional regulator [Streptomyces sp. NE5-10]GHJ97366.1 TetR family transcriptional regulator [Streptomyces sp. NE5-10]